MFWKDFQGQEAEIRQCLVDNDAARLESIAEEWEQRVNTLCGAHFFMEYAYDNFEMTFDTGPNKTTQYLAALCVKMAPASVKKHWICNATLPPLSQKAIQTQVNIKDETYALNDFYAFYETDDDNQTFAVQLYCPGYSRIENPERKKEMSMILVELSIGLLCYESYMGSIDFTDQPLQDRSFCNLIELYETVMDTASHRGWRTYDATTDIYSVYEPNQEIVHDALRKDMKFIFTTYPLLIEETLEGQSEDCRNDAIAKGASFQYIYYKNLFENEQDATLRQELSQTMKKVFEESHVASIIGGAIGKTYSYIDCIVYDKDKFDVLMNQIKKQVKQVDLYVQPF